VLFIALSVAIVMGYTWWVAQHPARPRPAGVAQQQNANPPAPAQQAGAAPAAAGQAPEKAEKPQPGQAAAPPGKIKAGPAEPRRWLTLGSADPSAKNPYRLLVTVSNRGAALVRIELSSPRYHDLDDRGGYLGHVVIDEDAKGGGCPVQVVGAGTPAAKAGLKPGDEILAVDAVAVRSAGDLGRALLKIKPGTTVHLSVLRDRKEITLAATLGWRPLEVVRPERKSPRDVEAAKSAPDAVHPQDNCPLSMLATLQQIDNQHLPEDEKAEVNLDAELPGVHLRTDNWRVVSADQEQVVFAYSLPQYDLELTKTYRLAKVPKSKLSETDFPAYHLEFELRIRSLGGKAHQVAYRLDGPNGLPYEGWWFTSKVSRSWGAAGMRDVVVSFDGATPKQLGCPAIAAGNVELPQGDTLTYMGVDAQYFSAVLMPYGDAADHLYQSLPIRVGDTDPERRNLTVNTSFRLTSAKDRVLKPGETLAQSFTLFAGPKRPPLLDQYKLGDVLYYGWFDWVAKPMLWILHQFYFVFRNYGVAIILLTVAVRLCMFPLSRKQALGAQKMQELQPEIKKIQEKHKKDMEARSKAQQELFRKHNYNPLSGCLLVFIQLPIFVGLYRSLMVDVELRDAPLISEAVRWCSNLAAPDMLYNWSWLMPWEVNNGLRWYGMGPFFNILPILTVPLFVLQQKMYSPPAADEQAAMQQKLMKFMTIFICFCFYKVASGLCIYFIASSLWGLAERKLLPKTAAAKQEEPPEKKPWPWSSGNGRSVADRKRKRNRGRK
jgi:YidC/Oxa1 family membrane protein insertase